MNSMCLILTIPSMFTEWSFRMLPRFLLRAIRAGVSIIFSWFPLTCILSIGIFYHCQYHSSDFTPIYFHTTLFAYLFYKNTKYAQSLCVCREEWMVNDNWGDLLSSKESEILKLLYVRHQCPEFSVMPLMVHFLLTSSSTPISQYLFHTLLSNPYPFFWTSQNNLYVVDFFPS